MFLPLQCQSVNERSMVDASYLYGTCSRYRYADGSAELLLFEYNCTTTKKLVACDLVVNNKKGDLYMHDFMLLKDGNWRNAFGQVAGTLAALLPASALTAKLVATEKIEKFPVRGENV